MKTFFLALCLSLAASTLVALPAKAMLAHSGLMQLCVVNTGNLKTIDRPAFRLQYPTSWRLGTNQQDFNADHNFTIMVEGTDSYIEIKIFKLGSITADQLMASLMETLDGPLIDTKKRESFTRWGEINGQGRHLMGEIAGFFEGGARIFVSTENEFGILVTELYYSDDKEKAMPGFELIRRSFQFK
ncbi:MAG: hypothetical protein AAGF10_05770 [Verrucomicrobiota bacterium]